MARAAVPPVVLARAALLAGLPSASVKVVRSQSVPCGSRRTLNSCGIPPPRESASETTAWPIGSSSCRSASKSQTSTHSPLGRSPKSQHLSNFGLSEFLIGCVVHDLPLPPSSATSTSAFGSERTAIRTNASDTSPNSPESPLRIPEALSAHAWNAPRTPSGASAAPAAAAAAVAGPGGGDGGDAAHDELVEPRRRAVGRGDAEVHPEVLHGGGLHRRHVLANGRWRGRRRGALPTMRARDRRVTTPTTLRRVLDAEREVGAS